MLPSERDPEHYEAKGVREEPINIRWNSTGTPERTLVSVTRTKYHEKSGVQTQKYLRVACSLWIATDITLSVKK